MYARAATIGATSWSTWRALVVVLLSLASHAWVPHVRALDVEVDAQTVFRVYEVRSSAADVFWTRRRLTQSFELRAVQELSEARPSAPPPVRLQMRVDLRLNQEFGDVCLIEDEGRCFAVTDTGVRSSYVPLASDGGIELPLASVEVVDDARGLLLAAGRQVQWDPIGLLRFDGARARVAPTGWFATEAYGGLIVRSSSVAGSDAFVPPGVLRVDLPEINQQAAEHVEPPIDTTAFGAAMWLGHDELARLGGYFRELRERNALVERSVAASLSSAYLRPLRIDANAVLDPVDGQFVNALAATSLALGRFTPHAEVQRRVPRFDRGSIWAYFDVAPVSEASVGLDIEVLRGPQWAPPMLGVGATLRGRRTELGTADDDDFGLQGHLQFASGRHRVALSAFGWDGGLGGVWGSDVRSDHRVTRSLTVSPRVSAFRIAAGGGQVQGVGMVEAVAVSMPATDEADIAAELVHSHGDSIGSRFGFLAWLHVGVWR